MRNLFGIREQLYGGGELRMVNRRPVCKARKLKWPFIPIFPSKTGRPICQPHKETRVFRSILCSTVVGVSDASAHCEEHLNDKLLIAYTHLQNRFLLKTRESHLVMMIY